MVRGVCRFPEGVFRRPLLYWKQYGWCGKDKINSKKTGGKSCVDTGGTGSRDDDSRPWHGTSLSRVSVPVSTGTSQKAPAPAELLAHVRGTGCSPGTSTYIPRLSFVWFYFAARLRADCLRLFDASD